MNVHKLLLGDGAERSLPFALAKLREWRAQHGDDLIRTQHYVQDGNDVVIRQVGSIRHIRIIAGGPAYEFFASETVYGSSYASPGDFLAGVPYIEGSGLRSTSAQAQPLFSTTLAGPWPMRAIARGGDTDLNHRSKDFFRTWSSWSVGWYAQYCWWLGNDPNVLVTSSFGAARQNMANTANWVQSSAKTMRFGYDVGYDIAPTLYDRTGTYGVLGPWLGNNVWWRHACVQEVESTDFGSKRFFVLGDTHGRIHVYPVKAYWADPVAVAATQNLTLLGLDVPTLGSTAIPFKTYTPPYPTWVTLPSLDTRGDAIWWSWDFNKDGTKAATVAFHSENASGRYWRHVSENGPGPFAHTLEQPFFEAPYDPATDPPIYDPSQKGEAPRKDTPGLVEIGITIRITGERDTDFEVDFALLQADYFGDSGRYYVGANYAFKDERLPVAEDALVTSEIELYNDNAKFYAQYIGTSSTIPTPFNADSMFLSDASAFDETAEDDGSHINTSQLPALQQFSYAWDAVRVSTVWVVKSGSETLLREVLDRNGWWFEDETVGPRYALGKFYDEYLADGRGGWVRGTVYVLAPLYGNYLQTINSGGVVLGTPGDTNAVINGLPYRTSFIRSYDLRTLSYVVSRAAVKTLEVSGSYTGNWTGGHRHELHAYAALVERVGADETFHASGIPAWNASTVTASVAAETELSIPDEPDVAARQALPIRALDMYAAAHLTYFHTWTYADFSICPNGNYALCAPLTNVELAWPSNKNYMFDRIVTRKKKGDGTFAEKVTTHRQRFNTAFQQERSDDFYATPEGYRMSNIGSYRLQGIWLPAGIRP